MISGNDTTRKILLAALLACLGIALAGFFLNTQERRESVVQTEEETSAVATDAGELSGDRSPDTAAWSYLLSETTAPFDELTHYYDEFFIFDQERPEEPASIDAPQIGKGDSGETPASSDEHPPALPERTSVKGIPALAIVVDDCGFSMDYARRLRDCDFPLTWAILPNLRFTRETADMLREQGTPFLVHVPMQAYVDPDGKAGGAKFYSIGVGMDEQDVQSAIVPLLDSLPEAYGVNNHRGSKVTSDPSVMRQVMNVLRERDLFFMDSSTSSKTVAYRTARAVGLDAVKNNYFLDNEADREKIRAQADRAIAGAKKRGSAVAICHLRPETISFFESTDASYFTSRGVRLVTLPELVELRKEMEGHE